MSQGSYLKKCRKKKGMTQKELSVKLGYSTSQMVSNIERDVQFVPDKKLRLYSNLTGAVPGTIAKLMAQKTYEDAMSWLLGLK